MKWLETYWDVVLTSLLSLVGIYLYVKGATNDALFITKGYGQLLLILSLVLIMLTALYTFFTSKHGKKLLCYSIQTLIVLAILVIYA